MKKILGILLALGLLALAGCVADADDSGGHIGQGGQDVGSVTADDEVGGDDNSDNADEPEFVAEPVVRVTDYSTRVASDEMVLHNGVRFGMGFDEVAALTGYAGEAPGEGVDVYSFEADAVWYGFDRDETGALVLNYMNVTEDAVDASIFRDIKIGDSIEDVFAKIPARDTELKKWAIQDLYGSAPGGEKGYAKLEFVAMSYYHMMIFTPNGGTAGITFSRDEICVKWIELYGPGL